MRFSHAAAAVVVAAFAVNGVNSGQARAEVNEVVLGAQSGAVYLPMMVMQQNKLVEKHLQTGGMGSVKVTWAKLGGPAALNDAIIAGSLHFSAQGVPSMSLLWDRTKGSINVKALGAIASNNIWLNTKNPKIKSLKDFTDKDRIAIPSLKVATQAVVLQFAAEQTWGKGEFGHLDHIIVALPHPDAMTAVLNPVGEITAHFATSPFAEKEIKSGLTTVATAFDIMGGPTTGITFASTDKFRTENPKVYAAALAAYTEAIDWINADKRRAAKLYIEASNDKSLSEDELTEAISGKDMIYTRTPSNVFKIVDFMHRVGTLKNKAASWKDLFFEEAHGLPGS
jgi:NitT/TauT family transport system substrate-binding protein